MRRILWLLVSLTMLVAVNAQARIEAQKITLDPTGGDEPSLLVKQDRGDLLTLEFKLPAFTIEDIPVSGEYFQAMTISGGDLRGLDGQAGLPVFTRLVAIPDGASVSVRVTASETRSLDGYNILPMQPEDADRFIIDRDYYSRTSRQVTPMIELGDQGIMHSLRVVPVTIHPVSYDPASRRIVVAESIEIEVDFSGTDAAALTPTRGRIIPESFDRLYRETVLNYRSGDAQVGPGSYMIIYENNATVLSKIQPLLEWRRRQGYNVIVQAVASTASASTIKSYIQTVFNTVDPPLEYVTLVGDASGTYDVACWNESLSGYNGEGDHYYTNLAGGDVLSDVHIGRLSFSDTNNLEVIVSKIVTYETSPPTSDPGWFTRAVVTGDPSSSGDTCIFVNQWLKGELIANGYTQVDTIWGYNSGAMMSRLSAGVSVFGYRGYYHMSGLDAGTILYASNGDMLAFAVIPTCDTGSFRSDGNARSEAFLRASNGGGIGAIGTATIGTDTRHNNCYYQGVWEGAINGEDHHLGFAHTRGKLELYNQLSGYENSYLEIWSMWNNLMGDPATSMWTAYPVAINVNYPASLPVGANSVPVSVTEGGQPVENALVTVYKEGQIQSSDYTDYSGDVNLPISGYSSGTLLVTVTKHNHMPHLGSLSLGSATTFAAYESSTVDDDNSGGSSGNSDGVVNPDETIELPVALHNYGSSTASNVTATISSEDTYIVITDGSESFGNIGAGATVWSGEDFDFTVAANTPDGHVIDLDLVASSGVDNWTSLIQLTVESADFGYESFAWAGGGATLDPGESGYFTVTARNNGSITANTTYGTLTCDSPWISISDPSGGYGNVAPGGTDSGGYDISISSDCFEGHLATFQITFTFNSGQVDVMEFSLPVGVASSNDPVGPDSYGYYAFDNTDSSYPYAPTYGWVEIASNYGGPGTSVGLSDNGYEQDDTDFLNLPFTFKYYGVEYDQISVCSNGWIAMGTTPVVNFQNYPIPGAGSPDPLISVFWDNLVQSGDNKVYYYYDVENSRFIVQWSRMRNYIHGSLSQQQNVQVILLDPAVHETPTGDGRIIMQYEQVNNSDYRDAYATVGIQNLNGTDGVLYTHANNYAPGAATLVAGRAILFTPLGGMNFGTLEGTVTNASNGGTPAGGVTIRVVERSQTIISGTDGNYSGSVEEGVYTIRAEHISFETQTVNNVSIIEDTVTELDFALVDILGPTIVNTTVLLSCDDTTGPYVVDTWITDYSEIDVLTLRYKLNGGGDFTAPLTLIDEATGHYRAEIPGRPINTQINYWIETEDIVGNTSRDPQGTDTYEFWILNSVMVIDDDMESESGWTVNADGGDDATTGIWTRVDPIGVWEGGTPVQPEDDASADGVNCWITGNAETGTQGADDVDGGTTSLYSPWFDLDGTMDMELNYRRWYTNNTGNAPGSDIWVVQVTNNGSDWVNLEGTSVSDQSWVLMTFQLEGFIEMSSTVRFRFVASDLGEGSVVEAGMDEFSLIGFEIPDPTAVPVAEVPAVLTLMQNSPNPFNPVTSIQFGLPTAEKVNLNVYDASGRLVRVLAGDRTMQAGFHSLSWNGLDDRAEQVSSGIYFYRLSTESQALSGKMTLLK